MEKLAKEEGEVKVNFNQNYLIPTQIGCWNENRIFSFSMAH